MTKQGFNLGRRHIPALGAAGLASWRAMAADVALPDIPPFPRS